MSKMIMVEGKPMKFQVTVDNYCSRGENESLCHRAFAGECHLENKPSVSEAPREGRCRRALLQQSLNEDEQRV